MKVKVWFVVDTETVKTGEGSLKGKNLEQIREETRKMFMGADTQSDEDAFALDCGVELVEP